MNPLPEQGRLVVASLLKRLKHDPIGLLVRAITKTILGRMRYGRAGGYDAERYWHDRLHRYGLSLRGPGHEGLSEEFNAEMYAEAARTFVTFCETHHIDLQSSEILEIGCGTGYWAQVCRARGCTDYTGLDITDALFTDLRSRFPEYRFLKGDVTEKPLPGQYDVVLMIDVVEHIVDEGRLRQAMEHARRSTRPGGAFIVALPVPAQEHGPKTLFYLRFWPESIIRDCFAGFGSTPGIAFRNGRLFALMAPVSSPTGPSPA